MARKPKIDRAKAKAQRQKKIAIGGAVLLAVVLVIQVPRTLKMLNSHAKPPVVQTMAAPTPSTAAAAGVATIPPTSAAPAQLVSAVQPIVDPGQLRAFNLFASKDPFAPQATGVQSNAAPTATTAAPTSPALAPTSAVISLNGQLMSVTVDTDFPTSGSIYDRSGALFHLVAVTPTSAKVTVVGGSYADGAPALTLHVGKAETLQNTADGTRYTLVLEPQGTQVPPASSSTTTTPSITPGG
jgi:hypothetical protein